jgi:hypothetical protein
MPQTVDRRKHRSDDPIVALHYQLSAVRNDAAFDALVLVDGAGCLVAGAGAWPACEELAAYAPLLAHGDGSRSEIPGESHVHSMEIDGSEVLLCARGGVADVTSAIGRAIAGVRRILGAEAC